MVSFITNRAPGTSVMQAGWIYFWYSDLTRFLVVLMGLHLIPTGLISYHYLGTVFDEMITMQYIGVLMWAINDNDYTKLHKIGLTVYRKRRISRN